MVKNECSGMHKFGPFSTDNNYTYYRVCLICGNRSEYPLDPKITKECEKQKITNLMIEIIKTKNKSMISDENYFLELVACLFDSISYIYLCSEEMNSILLNVDPEYCHLLKNKEEQDKIINSLHELNDDYNEYYETRYNLIKDAATYFKDYFDNYNNEIRGIYDEELCNELDERYSAIKYRFNLEIINMLAENNSIVYGAGNLKRN